MSKSSIEFRGKQIWWGDGDIELWLYSLARGVDRMPDPPRFLRDAREIWRQEYSIGFGGAPDPHLDEICTSDDRIRIVLELSRHALATLEQNPVIPRQELARDAVGGDYLWTADGDASGVIQLGRAIIDLLSSAMMPSMQ